MVPIDSAFDPNASGNVYAIALQPDGKILVGGTFAAIGGQARNNIARLEAISGAADGWNPDASGDVYAIALQPDGKIIVGGGFTNIGGQPRNRIARLDTTTGTADSFNPNANLDVLSNPGVARRQDIGGRRIQQYRWADEDLYRAP